MAATNQTDALVLKLALLLAALVVAATGAPLSELAPSCQRPPTARRICTAAHLAASQPPAPLCVPAPPARRGCAAGQCTGTCRSTTKTSGTLEVLDSTCKTSTKWSNRNTAWVVKPCTVVKYIGTQSVKGACNGVADGYTYILIE